VEQAAFIEGVEHIVELRTYFRAIIDLPRGECRLVDFGYAVT